MAHRVALSVSCRAESPQVVLYLEHNDDLSCMRIVAANLSKGVAQDIRFPEFDFTIVQDSNRDYAARSFLAKGILVLVPGAKQRAIVACGKIGELVDASVEGMLHYRRPRMFSRGFAKPSSERRLLD